MSREITHHFPGLYEALLTERASLQRDLLLWQRWIRYAAAALAVVGGLVMVVRDGRVRPWVPLFVAAALYFAFHALVARWLRRTGERAIPRPLPALVLGSDLVAVAAMVYLSTGPGHYYRVLLLGFLVVQLAAFYFGTPYAVWCAAATIAIYLGGSFAVRPWVPGPPPPLPLAAGFNVAYFVFVAGVLVAAFGSFRRRMDALRTFCKRVEVGDLTGRYDADRDRSPDDLTLLARSVDGMRQRLIDLVGTDPLTDCLNRRAFESRLSREWRQARRRGSCLAVIAVDVDNFKPINDTWGHLVGDQVLIELSVIMKDTARETDYIARLGGDEFVLLLPDTNWQGATTFAERLRRRVGEHHFEREDGVMPVTISVGVAVARGTDDVPPEYLLEEADRSLYKAKTAGRNRISA